MQKYFSLDDNFKLLIKRNLHDLISYKQISTGWTNFVFIATTKKSQYIFRFPRNDFFANALEKEFKINQFLQNKLSFKIPQMQLYYHKHRPYSVHIKLDGESLSSCYHKLTDKQKNDLAKDCCKLLKELSSIQLDPKNFQLVSNFLDELSFVSGNNYDLSIHSEMKNMEQKHLIFSHGDLNPGNLILKDHKLYAVIDFAFSGVSCDLLDIARLIGRCPNDLKKLLLNNYEKEFGKIDLKEIQKLQYIWSYVEEKYIQYMNQNCPDIVLSNLV